MSNLFNYTNTSLLGAVVQGYSYNIATNRFGSVIVKGYIVDKIKLAISSNDKVVDAYIAIMVSPTLSTYTSIASSDLILTTVYYIPATKITSVLDFPLTNPLITQSNGLKGARILGKSFNTTTGRIDSNLVECLVTDKTEFYKTDKTITAYVGLKTSGTGNLTGGEVVYVPTDMVDSIVEFGTLDHGSHSTLKYTTLNFALDATSSSIIFYDITSSAILRVEAINTIEAVANGTAIRIERKGGVDVCVDALDMAGIFINGVLVTQVLATAMAELNALFFHAGGVGNPPVITSATTVNLTHTFTMNYVLTGTNVVAVVWTNLPAGIAPVIGNIFNVIGGSALAVGTYTFDVEAINYYGSDSETITLNVALPPFSNTKSWNPQTSNGAYFRDDTAGQENNNVFYRSGATGSAWTVFGWAKTTRTSGWQANKPRPLINFGGDHTTNACVTIWYKRHNSYFHTILVRYGDSSNYVYGVKQFTNTTGVWFSWAVVYDGTATTSGSPFAVYIDGVLETLTWTVGGGGYSGTIEYQSGDDDSKLHIAKVFDVANSLNQTAYVDDIGCWASAKSASDISTYHNSGTPLNLGAYSPHSYFRFGDVPTDITAYPTLTNEGSTGNDITAYSGTVADYVSDVP